MDLSKYNPMGSGDYLNNVHEWSRDELSKMGVELDYLEDKKYGNFKPQKEDSHFSRWLLLGTLGLFVAFIVTFGSVNYSEKINDSHAQLPDISPTSELYEGHQLPI